VHRIHLRHDVDRVLQVARRIDARGLDLRELEQARAFEELDEQRAIGPGLLQTLQAAGLDRVEAGVGLFAAVHASTPSRSAMRSNCVSTSRVIESKSSGRSRIASSSRSMSGVAG